MCLVCLPQSEWTLANVKFVLDSLYSYTTLAYKIVGIDDFSCQDFELAMHLNIISRSKYRNVLSKHVNGNANFIPLKGPNWLNIIVIDGMA